MAQVNHFDIIEVAPLSAGKSTGVDDGNNQLMQGIADRTTVAISTTSPVTVASTVYTRAVDIDLIDDTTPPTAAFTVEFAARTSPDQHQGFKKVTNSTSYTATLKVASQSSVSVFLQPGASCIIALFADELEEVVNPIIGLLNRDETGTTYTLDETTDVNTLINFTNGSAVAVTIDTNANAPFQIGQTIILRQGGAGQVTASGAGGVTLNVPAAGGAKTRVQYSHVSLIKIATDTWWAQGDLA